eukprot:SAG11_NODE_3710_length_2267_cov_1.219096_1_plen_717_part_10
MTDLSAISVDTFRELGMDCVCSDFESCISEDSIWSDNRYPMYDVNTHQCRAFIGIGDQIDCGLFDSNAQRVCRCEETQEVSICAGEANVSGTNGTVNDGSPGYEYGANLDCAIVIQGPQNTAIMLNFTYVDTEEMVDVVRVYAGADDQAPLSAVITGQLGAKTVFVPSNLAFVRFVTDGRHTGAGWSLVWQAVGGDASTLQTQLASLTSERRLLGCYEDDTRERDLPAYFGSTFTSPEFCIAVCREYLYAGVQHGDQCFCGNTYGRYGAAVQTDCNSACASDSSQVCGGASRNSIYEVPGWTDDTDACECIPWSASPLPQAAADAACADPFGVGQNWCYVKSPSCLHIDSISSRLHSHLAHDDVRWWAKVCQSFDIEIGPMGPSQPCEDCARLSNSDPCACSTNGVSGVVQTDVVGCNSDNVCYVVNPVDCLTATASNKFPGAAYRTGCMNSATAYICDRDPIVGSQNHSHDRGTIGSHSAADRTVRAGATFTTELHGYQNDMDCVRTIRGRPGTRIKLVIEEFDTEAHHDTLTISHGSVVLAQYSGKITSRQELLSDSNQVSLRFVSDASVILGGWRVAYEIVNAVQTHGAEVNLWQLDTSPNSVAEFVGIAQYPEHPTNTWFLSPNDLLRLKMDATNFGADISFRFIPNEEGQWTFWISCDGACQMWLGSKPERTSSLVVSGSDQNWANSNPIQLQAGAVLKASVLFSHGSGATA